MSKLNIYTLLSLIVTYATVYHHARLTASLHQPPQFYPLVVKLMTNRISRIVVVNDALLFLLWMGRWTSRVFFGKLRDTEREKAWERSCVTVIETCLALTIFREELSVSVFSMFVLSLFVKIFHWIAQMRVQFIETRPTTSAGDFIRLYALLTALLLNDIFWARRFFVHFMTHGASVKLLFLTEHLILAIVASTILARLTLHLIYVLRDNTWLSRDRFVFYLNVVSDLVQSFVYIVNFVIIMSHYGIPIHLLRDFYMTLRSTLKRITDFLHYRKMVANMDTQFPDATEEELLERDTVCVICLGEMVVGSVKKLPCAHMLHTNCLRTYLESNADCPICKAPVDVDQYIAYRRSRGEPVTEEILLRARPSVRRAQAAAEAAAARHEVRLEQHQQDQREQLQQQQQQQHQQQQQQQQHLQYPGLNRLAGLHGAGGDQHRDRLFEQLHRQYEEHLRQVNALAHQTQNGGTQSSSQQLMATQQDLNSAYIALHNEYTAKLRQYQRSQCSRSVDSELQRRINDIMINAHVSHLEQTKQVVQDALDQMRQLQDEQHKILRQANK